MRVLVTGGGGFLGKAICLALAARGDQAIAMDLVAARELTGCATPITPVSADMTKAEQVCRVFEDFAPEAIIHCAAIVGVMVSIDDPSKVYRVNLEGSVNLFEAMIRYGVTRMLHISSEEIYGEFRQERIDEEHPQYPLFAYGISKAAVEHIGRTYRATHGLECINLRTFWVYGPGFPRDRVPCNLLLGAVRGKPVHVPCGAESRIDHTYVDDVVTGVLGALDCRSHPYDAYNIASDSNPSLGEVASVIRDLVPGAEISVGPGTYRHNGEIDIPRKGALDCSRAWQVFGYRPHFDIERGLAAYLTHLRDAQVREIV